MPEEMGIYRGEVLAIMGALADIRAEVRLIRSIVEDNDETEEEDENDS